MAGASTSELDFYQTAVPIFGFFSLLSVVEWFLLGRSRNLKGPYGFALISEVFKTIALSIGTQVYVHSVNDASSGDFSLLLYTNIGIIIMLGLTKFLRSRIEEYAPALICSRTFFHHEIYHSQPLSQLSQEKVHA